MQSISEPLYVYLQRPDNGEWVTVGRYQAGPAARKGYFRYAPSYVDAGHAWSIDPVNLPFAPETDKEATRYGGLHDVLRDVCPDAWGQALLQREHNLPSSTPMSRYLLLASNADRWGALAIGTARKPSIAELQRPRLPQLSLLVEELGAIHQHLPPVDIRLRRRLVQTASVGGARPKATLQDDDGQFWLVKPQIATDITDIPFLEHVGQQWGAASGLNFAQTILHRLERDPGNAKHAGFHRPFRYIARSTFRGCTSIRFWKHRRSLWLSRFLADPHRACLCAGRALAGPAFGTDATPATPAQPYATANFLTKSAAMTRFMPPARAPRA